MKKTRKNLSRRKKTYRRKRGGKVPCDARDDLVYIWRETTKFLTSTYDPRYGHDWHKNNNWDSCNLWVWKRGFSTGEDDKHLDIYWTHNYGGHTLNVRASRTTPRGKVIIDNYAEDLTNLWNEHIPYNSPNKWKISAEVARFIEQCHRAAFGQ